jgi:hypothetical protein
MRSPSFRFVLASGNGTHYDPHTTSKTRLRYLRQQRHEGRGGEGVKRSIPILQQPVGENGVAADVNYVDFLNGVKQRIHAARIGAYRHANRELLDLYWHIGISPRRCPSIWPSRRTAP